MREPGKPISTRYQSLDHWRGLACLMIVLLHGSFYAKYDPAAGGGNGALNRIGTQLLAFIGRLGIGVPMFFVISGFCIAATADSTRRKGKPSLNYFKRRFRRIFPPYWAALVFTIGIALAFWFSGHAALLQSDGHVDTGTIPQPASLTPWQWLGNLTLTEEWRFHLFGDARVHLLGPSWTLCYEEQFYVVCGLILLVASKRFFSGIAWVTGATAVVALCASLLNWPIDGFFFDGRWLLFAAGVFVFQHLIYAKAKGSQLVPALSICLALLLVLRYVVLRHMGSAEQRDQVFVYIIGTIFALGILFLHRYDAPIAGAMLLKPFAFCGRMCYSLYLVHWPVCKVVCALLFLAGVRGVWPTLLVSIPAGLVVSLIIAWGFYLLVERRFLNPPNVLPAGIEKKSPPQSYPDTAPAGGDPDQTVPVAAVLQQS